MNDHLEQIQADVAEIKFEIKSIGWIVTILIGIIFVSALFNSNGSNDKVTDYSRSCNQENVSAQNCTSWNLGKTTYYVNADTQEVFFVEGTYRLVPFSGCTVADTENWYCSDISGVGLGYSNGAVIDNTLASQTFATQHFGRLTYWWYKILSWV